MSQTFVYFSVDGKPRPKGSMRSVGRGVMVESTIHSRPWRERVLWAAKHAAEQQGWERIGGRPVEVNIQFFFDKPKSAPKTYPSWPCTRSTGDVDKLARNILDAIVDAGLIVDDSQVINLQASKCFTSSELSSPCALVTVQEVVPDA